LIVVRCEPSGVAEGCHYQHDVLDGHADQKRIVAMAIASGQAGSYDLDALVVSDVKTPRWYGRFKSVATAGRSGS
jgi:hypothetical protein